MLLDPQFVLLSCARAGSGGHSWSSDDPGARRLLQALATERRPLRVPAVPDSVLPHGCLAVPIAIGPSDLGYLLLPDDSVEGASDDTDLLPASYGDLRGRRSGWAWCGGVGRSTCSTARRS